MLPIALELLSLITNKGYEAYIVGGYVRDRYIKKKVMMLIFVQVLLPKN